MASNLIKVKEAGAYKLGMPQVRGWVTKVEEVMKRLGWLTERGPEATLMICTKVGRIEDPV